MNHFERLTKVYLAAPIHSFYEGISIVIEPKRSTISLPIKPSYFHGGMATHGSVYFKLLDDAAYFACQSEIQDVFIVTTNFNINLLRPIKSGLITAIGEVEFISRNLFTASAKLYDDKNRLCATGQGQFMKNGLPLTDLEHYS